MIYWLLFYEFFKVGLFAIGGGLVTIPFLFDLAETYPWFTTEELSNMIAVSESTPGPLGVNMAVYAGYKTAGIAGAFCAVTGLTFPSVVIIIVIARFLSRYSKDERVRSVLSGIRPAVLALILMAGAEVGKLSLTTWLNVALFVLFFVIIRKFRFSPILYIVIAAGVGIVLKL